MRVAAIHRPRLQLALFAVILVGVALRITLCSLTVDMALDSKSRSTDEAMYLELALNLRDTGAFASSWERNFFDRPFWPVGVDESHVLKPNLLRTPVFPALLAVALTVHESFAAVLGLNCLFFVATCLGLYGLGRTLGHELSGLAAAAWLALDPLAVLNSTKALSDLPLLALLVTAFACLARAWKEDGSWWVYAAYVLLALSALTKPVVLYTIPAITITWAVARRGKRGMSQAFVGSMISVLIVGLWVERNFRVYEVGALSSAGAFNAVEFHAMALAQEDQSILENFFDQGLGRRSFVKRDELLNGLYQGLEPTRTNAQTLAALQHDGLAFVRDNPTQAGRMWIIGAARLLFNGAWTRFIHVRSDLLRPWHVVFAIVNALSIALATIGVMRVYRKGDAALVLVLLMMILVLVILSAPAANPRLRLPFFPLVNLLATIGIYQLATFAKNRTSWRNVHAQDAFR